MDGQLSPNFIFYHDGEQLGTEGGGATKTYPGKPYVDYELTTRKSGLLTGEVGQLKSTAHVYGVPCKYYRKIPKFLDARNFGVIHLKFKQKWPILKIFVKNMQME